VPALKNQRQERFCQLVKRGIPPYRAYPMAGYQPDEGAPYRLSGNVRVKQRINELTRHIAMKTRVTVESLTEELNRAIEIAEETKNPSALTGATIAKGKLHGLMIDRREAGAPGDFAGLDDEKDLIAAMRRELGDQVTNAIVASVNEAEVEQLPEPPAPVPTKPPAATSH
jgi:hypothetical protein